MGVLSLSEKLLLCFANNVNINQSLNQSINQSSVIERCVF